MKITAIRASFRRNHQPAQYQQAEPAFEAWAEIQEGQDPVTEGVRLMVLCQSIVYAGIGAEVPEAHLNALEAIISDEEDDGIPVMVPNTPQPVAAPAPVAPAPASAAAPAETKKRGGRGKKQTEAPAPAPAPTPAPAPAAPVSAPPPTPAAPPVAVAPQPAPVAAPAPAAQPVTPGTVAPAPAAPVVDPTALPQPVAPVPAVPVASAADPTMAPTVQHLMYVAGEAAKTGKKDDVMNLLQQTYGVRRIPDVPEGYRQNLLVHLNGLAGIET